MKSFNLDTNDKRSAVIPKSTQYYQQNKEKMREYMRNYFKK